MTAGLSGREQCAYHFNSEMHSIVNVYCPLNLPLRCLKHHIIRCVLLVTIELKLGFITIVIDLSSGLEQ